MADRNTPWKDGIFVVIPVKSGQLIEAGHVVLVSGGEAVSYAGKTTDAVVAGVATHTADNRTAGGDSNVTVRRCAAFQLDNASTHPVTKKDLFKPVLLTDGYTVATKTTDDAINNITAGRVLELTSDGVWIWID